jgi:hypothetical protein
MKTRFLIFATFVVGLGLALSFRLGNSGTGPEFWHKSLISKDNFWGWHQIQLTP